MPDSTHNNFPLVKYSYTYTPVGGAETTIDVTDVSKLESISVVTAGDVTLDAYYQEAPAKKYKITVIDETYGSDQKTLINRMEREVKEVPEGRSYTVSAQTPEGFYNLGEDTITGTANEDGEVVFKYARYIVLNVEDVYNESDGTLIEKVSRTPVQRKLNEAYSVAAQPEHGGYSYNIIGNDKYEGTATADMNLTFTYRKKAHYKVTIIDKYYEPDGETPIEEVERPVKEYPEGSTPVLKPDPKPGFDPKDDGDKTIPDIDKDTVIIFEYVKRVTVTVVDEYYAEDGSTLVDFSTRPTETYRPGTGYSITPQSVHGGKTYTVMNPEVLSGTATSDVTVYVKYRCDEQQKKLFRIAVYDEYYEADGITLKERVLRSNEEYAEGSSQTFSAIAKEGYSVFSPASGTIQVDNLGADTEIVFKYKAASKPSGGNDNPDKPGDDDDTPTTPPKKPSGGGGGGSKPAPPVTTVTPPTEPETPPVEQPVTPPETPEPDELPPVEPEKTPVKKEFTITVIDKCFDHKGTALLSYDRRLVETVEEGSEYSYSALDLDGFKVRGVSTHEGTVHGNLILEFTYVREAQHTITVVDKYVSTDKIPYTPEHPEDIIASSTYTDTNGGTTYTVLVTVRQVDVVPEGSPYEYHAKEPKGFTVSGQKVLTGRVNDDLVLEFTYVIDGIKDVPEEVKKPVDKELVKPRKVLITVVDKYISEEPISDGEDTVTVETIKGEDGRTYVVTGSVRVVEALVDGTGYEYKALDLDGFEVKGSRVARGKATADKTVEFVYTTIDDGEVPVGIFQHEVNYAKKTADDEIKTFIPHAEEPKTGEGIPLASTGFMMLALAFIEYLKKKFRR